MNFREVAENPLKSRKKNLVMKKIICLGLISLVLCISLPHSSFAQNTIKKVKYLGHKYKGQVNKKKVPEGRGKIIFIN